MFEHHIPADYGAIYLYKTKHYPKHATSPPNMQRELHVPIGPLSVLFFAKANETRVKRGH